MLRFLLDIVIGFPLYVLIYGGEHIIEKLRGRREEYTWFGRLKYVVCLGCNQKLRLPMDPNFRHDCPSRR